MKRKRIVIILIALVAAAFGGPALWRAWRGAPATGSSTTLTASGTIEAHTVAVSSAVSGRLAALTVAEGEEVAAGVVVAELDATLADAELARTRAALAESEAAAALLQAGARTADLDVARAALRQAQVARSAAQVTAEDAAALVNAPGDLDLRIIATETTAAAAEEQLTAARAAAAAAEAERAYWEALMGELGGAARLLTPPEKLAQANLQWNLAGQRAWQTSTQSDLAAIAAETARGTLADLRSQRADPQTARTQAHAAEAAYHSAEAAEATAQAALDLALANAPAEQIAAADALVEGARSAVAAAVARRNLTRLTAPAAGTVSELLARPGEIVAVGAPVARLGDLRRLTLTVYIAEGELGRVAVGQAVQVVADAYPGRTFAGAVAQVADQAVFTPKNVQTRVERANTVFAVKISLENAAVPNMAVSVGILSGVPAGFGRDAVEGRRSAPAEAASFDCAANNPLLRSGCFGKFGTAVENAAGALRPGMAADARFCPAGETDCRASAGGGSAVTGLLERLPWLRPPAAAQEGSQAGALQASGVLEATETTLAAEIGGRVVTVAAAEGEPVAADQALVILDAAEWTAKLGQAQAAQAAARADLARVQAPPQAARVAQAQAQLAQAETARDGALAALADAQAARAQPLALDAQVNQAQAQVRAAAAQVELARANQSAARALSESLPAQAGNEPDRVRRSGYDQQVLAAAALLRAAEAQQRGADKALAQLRAIRAEPVALDAALRRAAGQAAVADAAAQTAAAALAQVQAPPQPQAVALAQARVAGAQAITDQAAAALAKLTLRSPLAGTVTARMIQPGEAAQPGAALLTLLDLAQVRLVVFVPAAQIGQVRLGERAAVTVDAYPGRTFGGAVTHIAAQAEFTPKNVQTSEGRAALVFRVELTMDDAGGALRPGMPADATLTGR